MAATYYHFTDEAGTVLYREVRLPDKRIFYQRPDGRDGWIDNLDGVRYVPYNLHHLVTSTEPILWVEGPKDAETLITLGFLATTCAHGADGWRPEYAEPFRGRCVYGLRDNDDAGLKLRESMERDTVPVAKCVHRGELPGLAEKEDVTDWLAKGHTLQELIALLDEAGKVSVPLPLPVAAEPVSPPTERAPEERATGISGLVLPPFPEEAFVGPLEEWRAILRRYTNAPDAFLWAGFMATWGLALGRRLYVASPRRLYAGNYYLLLSETARARKSTALWIGSELLQLLHVPYLFVRGLGSIEGLYHRMAKAKGEPVLLYVDEFRSLLGVAQRKVTENIFPRLNTLWDYPDKDEITKVETVEVNAPTVVLVAATPLQYVEDRLSEEHFVGGVLNRYLVLVGPRQKTEAWPPALTQSVIEPVAQRLAPCLGRLPKGESELLPDSDTRELYTRWFDAFDERLDTKGELLESLFSRLPQHVHKMALNYAALLQEDRLTLAAYRPALAVAEYVARVGTQLFSRVGLTPRARLEERVLESIRRGKNTAKAIKNDLGGRVSMDDVNRALDALVIGGSVVRDNRKTPKGREYHGYSLAEEEALPVNPPESAPPDR